MNNNVMARAFNEWMRRYTDEPERFAREFQMVGEFLEQTERGEEPTYGETAAAYLVEIMRSIDEHELGQTENGTATAIEASA